ncbi:MAG: undecaprenyl-diphosphate phosphatase [Thermoplasmata archaeon]
MDWLEAIFLGLIQGLTEWLPVSSSGHLALAQHWLGEVPLIVDVFLHFGTLFVILVFFRMEVLEAVRGGLELARALGRGEGLRRAARRSAGRRMAALVAVGTIPTVLIGLLFNYTIGGSLFTHLTLVGLGFLLTGVLLILTRVRQGRETRGRGVLELGATDALVMGIAQGLAVLPGFSRSGWTIGTGLLGGVEGETAARLSFLLYLPAVSGALILRLPDLAHESGAPLLPALLGTTVAVVVGYLTLGLLTWVVRRRGFQWFGPYCLAAGVFVLLWTLL